MAKLMVIPKPEVLVIPTTLRSTTRRASRPTPRPTSLPTTATSLAFAGRSPQPSADDSSSIADFSDACGDTQNANSKVQTSAQTHKRQRPKPAVPSTPVNPNESVDPKDSPDSKIIKTDADEHVDSDAANEAFDPNDPNLKVEHEFYDFYGKEGLTQRVVETITKPDGSVIMYRYRKPYYNNKRKYYTSKCERATCVKQLSIYADPTNKNKMLVDQDGHLVRKYPISTHDHPSDEYAVEKDKTDYALQNALALQPVRLYRHIQLPNQSIRTLKTFITLGDDLVFRSIKWVENSLMAFCHRERCLRDKKCYRSINLKSKCTRGSNTPAIDCLYTTDGNMLELTSIPLLHDHEKDSEFVAQIRELAGSTYLPHVEVFEGIRLHQPVQYVIEDSKYVLTNPNRLKSSQFAFQFICRRVQLDGCPGSVRIQKTQSGEMVRDANGELVVISNTSHTHDEDLEYLDTVLKRKEGLRKGEIKLFQWVKSLDTAEPTFSDLPTSLFKQYADSIGSELNRLWGEFLSTYTLISPESGAGVYFLLKSCENVDSFEAFARLSFYYGKTVKLDIRPFEHFSIEHFAVQINNPRSGSRNSKIGTIAYSWLQNEPMYSFKALSFSGSNKEIASFDAEACIIVATKATKTATNVQVESCRGVCKGWDSRWKEMVGQKLLRLAYDRYKDTPKTTRCKEHNSPSWFDKARP